MNNENERERKQFKIPPRLQNRNGILGQFKLIDIVCTGILAILGLAGMFAIRPFHEFASIIFLLVCLGIAFIVFILPLPYEENLRILIQRMIVFNSRQKKYLYKRTYNQPVLLKKETRELFEQAESKNREPGLNFEPDQDYSGNDLFDL